MLKPFKDLSHLSRLSNKNLRGVTLLTVFLHHIGTWGPSLDAVGWFFFFFSHSFSILPSSIYPCDQQLSWSDVALWGWGQCLWETDWGFFHSCKSPFQKVVKSWLQMVPEGQFHPARSVHGWRCGRTFSLMMSRPARSSTTEKQQATHLHLYICRHICMQMALKATKVMK